MLVISGLAVLVKEVYKNPSDQCLQRYKDLQKESYNEQVRQGLLLNSLWFICVTNISKVSMFMCCNRLTVKIHRNGKMMSFCVYQQFLKRFWQLFTFL